MSDEILPEAKSAAQRLTPASDFATRERIISTACRAVSARENAELRTQLQACVAASKDMHAAQAETIDDLRAKLADTEQKRLLIAFHLHDCEVERDAAIARAEAAEKARNHNRVCIERLSAERDALKRAVVSLAGALEQAILRLGAHEHLISGSPCKRCLAIEITQTALADATVAEVLREAKP